VESAIFLFTRRVLAFLRVNPAKSFYQPNFFNPGRLCLSIVGSSSGKPGETGTGGRKKNQKIGEFSFRSILQPTTTGDRTWRLQDIRSLRGFVHELITTPPPTLPT